MHHRQILTDVFMVAPEPTEQIMTEQFEQLPLENLINVSTQFYGVRL